MSPSISDILFPFLHYILLKKSFHCATEVAHSIFFYAPMYVAIEEGYFKEEGIELELVTGYGADKTMTALLCGEADIGFMGSEASIIKKRFICTLHINRFYIYHLFH